MLSLILALALHQAAISPFAQQSMLADTNATRMRAGRPALVLDPLLCRVAAEHALDMAQHKYFAHETPAGASPFDRMKAANVPFHWAGENIALAGSEPIAYTALVNSPEHLANILQPHFARVGIGAAIAPDGTMLFVEDFTD